MKYMLMMFGDGSGMEGMAQADFGKMIQFMHGFNDELTKAGELVAAEGLAWPQQAKTVTSERGGFPEPGWGHGVPLVTDGPYAEAKESIIGFWIVDVADEARALDLAQRVVTFTSGPMEVRQVPDGPPMGPQLRALREITLNICGAQARHLASRLLCFSLTQLRLGSLRCSSPEHDLPHLDTGYCQPYFPEGP